MSDIHRRRRHCQNNYCHLAVAAAVAVAAVAAAVLAAACATEIECPLFDACYRCYCCTVGREAGKI